MTNRVVSPEEVLRALDVLDAEEGQANTPERAPTPDPAQAAAPADASPKPAPAPAPAQKAEAPAPAAGEPTPALDEAMKMVWDLAAEAVQARCPDLDEEMLAVARSAAAGSPIKFKEIALRMQERLTRAKEGAPVSNDERVKQEVAKAVFRGAEAGGDANAVPAPKSKSVNERLADAVAGKGKVLDVLVDAIREGKLLGESVDLT
jgi:hypothetical protein